MHPPMVLDSQWFETLQVLAHVCALAHTFPRMFFPSLSSLLPHVQQANTYSFSLLIASATFSRALLTALILQHYLLACLPPHCAMGPLVQGQRGVFSVPPTYWRLANRGATCLLNKWSLKKLVASFQDKWDLALSCAVVEFVVACKVISLWDAVNSGFQKANAIHLSGNVIAIQFFILPALLFLMHSPTSHART